MSLEQQERATRDADRLPVDPHSGQPIHRIAQPGYYPGFSTLAQQSFWDEATRDVVLQRVEQVPPIRFFTPSELKLMTAVLDRVIPQDDRDDEHKIPVVNYIDDRLSRNEMDGYRYEDMPPNREAFRLGLQAIDDIAGTMHGKPFVECSPTQQDEVLWSIHEDRPQGGDEIWKQMPADRFWILLVTEAADAYYAHPYAWDEIGFGGPAYPRGYFRLENGQPEPWEVTEQRYEWAAPPSALSDRYKPLGGRHPHRAPAGQEGTH
jgi:hypothetical protein